MANNERGKKAFPMITLPLALLILAIATQRVAGIRNINYITVLEGSKVAMHCPYEGADPNQVLWVKGKKGIMSLDGLDFFTIAKTLDPEMTKSYRLESEGTSSTLVIDAVTMGNLENQHPGVYKCIIDLFKEFKYQLSVVKNDLTCRRVGQSEGTKEGDPFQVGYVFEVECEVTKDRDPFGKIDFVLSVGDEDVEVESVYGERMWRQKTDVAKVRFAVPLLEKYYAEKMRVRVDLTKFDEEDEEAVVVVESLRLTNGIRVDCPPSQFYIQSYSEGPILGDDTHAHILGDGAADEDEASPLPYCLVHSRVPFGSDRIINWQLVGTTNGSRRLSYPFTSSSQPSGLSDDSTETTYRVDLERNFAGTALRFFESEKRLIFSISDLDSTWINATFAIRVHLEPQLECLKQNPVFEVGSNRSAAQSCKFLSCPRLQSVTFIADSPVEVLKPAIVVKRDVDQSESPCYSMPFEMSFPVSSPSDAARFVKDFQSSHGVVSGESVEWTERLLPTPVTVVEVTVAAAHGLLTNASLENGEGTVVNGSASPASDEASPLDISNGDDDSNDSVSPSSSVLTSELVPDELSTKPEMEGAGVRNERAVDFFVDKVTEKVVDIPTEGHEKGVTEGPARTMSISYEPLSLPDEIDKRELVALFKTEVVYRVGSYERKLDFFLPAFRLSYVPTLRCKTLGSSRITCWYLSIPVVDLSSIYVWTENEDFADIISGRILRTADGFDVSVEVAKNNDILRGKKFDVVVKVHSSVASDEARVKLDFPHLPHPASPAIKMQNKDEEEKSEEGLKIAGIGKANKSQNDANKSQNDANKSQNKDEEETSEEGLKIAGIGKVVEPVDPVDPGDPDDPSALDSMMAKQWFLPVVGAVGGVAVLVIGIAIFAGVRSRAGRGPAARMEQHRLVHPEEHDEGFAAGKNSVAPSEEMGDPDAWTGDGGFQHDKDNGGNKNNNNSNNNGSDDNGGVRPTDFMDESDENNLNCNNGHNFNNNNGIDAFRGSRDSSYDAEAVLFENGVDETDPFPESLVVPDEPPAKIKKASAVKAMQSFPANILSTSPRRTAPAPPAEVDV